MKKKGKNQKKSIKYNIIIHEISLNAFDITKDQEEIIIYLKEINDNEAFKIIKIILKSQNKKIKKI